MSVTITDTTQTAPIVCTAPAHGFTTGQVIVISTATSDYNGTWEITVIDADHFSLNQSSGVDPYGGGVADIASATITNATNASPIVCTATAHGFLTGYIVKVSQIVGNTAANGSWTIIKVTNDSFSLTGSTGNGAYSSGGLVTVIGVSKAISDATNASPIVITANGHNLTTGQIVDITAVAGNTAANGTWLVTMIDANTFSLSDLNGNASTGNSAYTSGGNFSVHTISGDTNGSSTLSIKEYTAITGTGDVALLGAVSGFAPFSSLADGTPVEYSIEVVDSSGVPTGVYEVGRGTYVAATNTVTRDAIGGTSVISDPAGPLDFAVAPKTISAVQYPIDEPQFVQTAAGGDHGIFERNVQDALRPGAAASDGTGGTASNAGVGFSSGGNRAFRCTGLISMSGMVTVANDGQRQGEGNTVTFAPMGGADGTDPGTVDLLSTGYYWIPQSKWRSWERIQITPMDRSVPRQVNRSQWIQLRLDQPSPIPFAYDADAMQSQATTKAGIPADVFLYLPWTGRYSTPRPVMFYVNWWNGQSRKNPANANQGHSVRQVLTAGTNFGQTCTGQVFLDCGDAWVTETSIPLTDQERYLYLGTVCGCTDGTAICLPRHRMTWSQYNRWRYTDTSYDQAPPSGFWDVAWLNDRARMHYQALSPEQSSGQRASTWRHFALQMAPVIPNAQFVRDGLTVTGLAQHSDPRNLKCSMSATCWGYVRAEIRTWPDGALCVSRITAKQSLTSITTPDARSDNTVIGRKDMSLSNAIMDKSEVPVDQQLGFHVWSVLQTYLGGAGQERTRRFFGSQQPMTIGEPSIRFVDANGQPVIAGPAWFSVSGEC